MKIKSQVSLPLRTSDEYRVLMPVKKLNKSLSVITPKTYGKAMGDINRFLSKDCYHLCGYTNKKIGEKPYRIGNQTIMVNEYDDKLSPNYQYFEGYCGDHYLYKWRKENSCAILRDIPRLAIHIPFGVNCIPIHFGDKYKIFGNRLVIYHKYNKAVADTPWLRYDEFILADTTISTEDKLLYEYNGRINQIGYDYLSWFHEYIEFRNDADNDSYREIADQIYHQIMNELSPASKLITLKSVKNRTWPVSDKSNNIFTFILSANEVTKEIEIDIDVNKFFNSRADISEVVTFKGTNSEGPWVHHNLLGAIRTALSDWVIKTNVEREKEYEDYSDGQWGDSLLDL